MTISFIPLCPPPSRSARKERRKRFSADKELTINSKNKSKWELGKRSWTKYFLYIDFYYLFWPKRINKYQILILSLESEL